jgi:hypothetical protein
MSTLGIVSRKAKPFNASAGTHTRDGFEPHMKVTTAHGLAFHAPVKVNPPLVGEILPRTQTDRNGRKLYALPGGGEVAV